MAAELDVIAPMVGKVIPPGGKILHLGTLSGEYEDTLCNVSGFLTEVDRSAPLDDISSGFDTIIAPFTLQHIVQDDVYGSVIRRLHESLKPGGALIVVDHEDTGEKIEDIFPRGMLGVLDEAPWLGAQNEVCTYSDHWFAIFLKKPCELPEEPCPVFREADDGKIFVEEDPGMPDRIAIAIKLFANPRFDRPIERDGDRVTINAENGRWVFKIVGWGRHGEAVCQLGRSN